ncbi:hypothetical protein KS664_003060 [Clostridium perfringens]|nr:hypothetical protein [Clostridium perfringens]
MNENDKLFVYMDLISFDLILTCTALSAKVYKEGELFFKEKFTGGLAEENSELKVDNKALLYKYNIKVLEEDKKRIASEIDRLKLENKKLQLEVDKHNDDTKELIALRNYMFNNSLDS